MPINILLTSGLVFTLGLLFLTVIDPLWGQSKSAKARVVSSNDLTSIIALPNGTIGRIKVGNLTQDSRVMVGVKQRLFSGSNEYQFQFTLLPTEALQPETQIAAQPYMHIQASD
ncbi:hypothetical protein [Shewanella youngdeokensis]|uniref:Uncharacterized protein n=1 Tax=Shewanella youngdeokensis TaxID=2999068 RepID=A0ABZ0JZ36_9GAMM|nr:hypothetical protein RGE70_01700 [Shewanella sp. DAU334]